MKKNKFYLFSVLQFCNKHIIRLFVSIKRRIKKKLVSLKRRIVRFVYMIIRFFLKEKKFIILHDDICRGKVENSEALPLFRYLKSKGVKDVKYLIHKNHPQKVALLKEKDVLIYDSRFFSKKTVYFLKAKAIVTSFESPLKSYLPDVDIIFLQHGIFCFKTKIIKTIYHKEQSKFKKVVISNKMEAGLLKKYGGYDDDDFIKCGLVRFQIQKEKLKGAEEENFSIFYFPTFKKEDNSLLLESYKTFINNTRAIVKDKNITVYIGRHHGAFARNDFIQEFNKIEMPENFKVLGHNQIGSCVGKCDMLITDYSSLTFDFMILKKPVIFYRTNLNLYRGIDEEEIQSAMKEDDKIFNICYDDKDFVKLLKFYIKNKFKLENEKINKSEKFFEYCDNPLKQLTKYLTESK
ncbi:MAG: CDP-glycerol glycerophosphotransferase family protein [Alphaproteobacteria bacterium]|nr:CDP-glycerol glycerophosphotransferase family protein [Alphaproteobacteria bacterium]